jgi:hypothetical protein
MSRLWVLSVLGLIAVLGIACSDESESVPEPSATSAQMTAAPIATPSPTRSPIPSYEPPEGWERYAQSSSTKSPAFSVAYPDGWFRYGGATEGVEDSLSLSFYSFDRIVWNQPTTYPPEAMKVDVHVANAERLETCGPGGGEPARLADFDAQQLTENYDPPHPSGLVRSITISGVYAGHCYIVLGAFAQRSPDEATFFEIVKSFTVVS